MCHPFKAKTLCSVRRTYFGIAGIVIATVTSSGLWCLQDDILRTMRGIGFAIFRIILYELIPCILLFHSTRLLNRVLRESSRFNEATATSLSLRRRSESREVTKMTTAIAIVFGIAEIPVLVGLSLDVFPNDHIASHPAYRISIDIMNIIVITSYQCNFWIYCCMCRRFRMMMLNTLCCSKYPYFRQSAVYAQRNRW